MSALIINNHCALSRSLTGTCNWGWCSDSGLPRPPRAPSAGVRSDSTLAASSGRCAPVTHYYSQVGAGCGAFTAGESARLGPADCTLWLEGCTLCTLWMEGKGDEVLFGWLIFRTFFSLAIAAHCFEVVAEFLDFEEVEDLLGFEDAVLFEKKIGEIAISFFDCR